jgi:hypothetical protein
MVLTIRVIPRSSNPGIAVEADGSLKVRLQSPPVEGAANAELVEVLAKALGVPRRAVTIVGGVHARAKRVQIDGIDERRLATCAAGHPRRQPLRTPRR